MAKVNEPLVSVPVITYNSSKYVIETLESIKAQTYQNIELIVSDDCSTDNTVELCRNWIDNNKDRFVRTELLTVKKNTGVSGNCNRAAKACCGEWVKGIAGDDILFNDCIQTFVSYVNTNSHVEYVFSRICAFGENESVNRHYNDGGVFDYSFFQLSTEKQLESFVFGNVHIPAPTAFYKRECNERCKIVNDERIPDTEDVPKWINLLTAGVHFYFIDKPTVYYRIGHAEALSSHPKQLTKERFRAFCIFQLYYRFPEQYKRNSNLAVEKLTESLCDKYSQAYYLGRSEVEKTKSYRVGQFMLIPIRSIKRIFNVIKNR